MIDTSAIHILEQLAIEVEQFQSRVARPLALIAESDLYAPRIVEDRSIGGYGMSAQWNDDSRHSLHTAITGEHNGYHADVEGLRDLPAAIEQSFVYDGRFSAYRGRRHGRSAALAPKDRFVAYSQNHDQVGAPPAARRPARSRRWRRRWSGERPPDRSRAGRACPPEHCGSLSWRNFRHARGKAIPWVYGEGRAGGPFAALSRAMPGRSGPGPSWRFPPHAPVVGSA